MSEEVGRDEMPRAGLGLDSEYSLGGVEMEAASAASGGG
jgi:hypothetical protein